MDTILSCRYFSPVTSAAHHHLARHYGNDRNGKYFRSVGCSAKELGNLHVHDHTRNFLDVNKII